MICFPCFCGEQFSLSEDMAGGMFQCKKCGRLVTVPTLDDLPHLKPDGTYDFGLADPGEQKRIRQGELPPDSAISSQEAEPMPIEEFQAPARVAPRYDPFTGELIRAHEVIVTEPSAAQKAPPRVQRYNSNRLISLPPRPIGLIPLELFRTSNVVVILVMLAIHYLMVSCFYCCLGMGMFPFYFVPIALAFCLLGEYSLIVQETGPEEKDELPTLLRHGEFREDVWDPFVHFVLACVVSYAPAVLWVAATPNSPPCLIVAAALFLFGGFLFPAVFLVLVCGGVLANLRPDRLLAVFAKAPAAYLLILSTWALGSLLLLAGMAGQYEGWAYLFTAPSLRVPRPWYVPPTLLAFLLAFAGLHLSYYACWVLGVIWRKHHAEFGWVAQRFTKDKPLIAHPPPKGPGPSPA